MFTMLKCYSANKIFCSGNVKELCKVFAQNNVKYQIATLTRLAFRDEDEVPNIKPFPYYEKRMGIFNFLFVDSYKNRVNKHTKLIVIDGSVAAGKANLAKDLAKQFNFLYLPQPSFDDHYIEPSGFDIRSLDCKFPKATQTWDIERFLQDPQDINTAAMQLNYSLLRQKLYIEALAHIFCTGQGVVTVRSPWSDIVFSKAMHQSGYISKGALEACLDSYDASLFHYLKPHLIIYLDVPVKKTLENIQNSDSPCEVNSKVLNAKYLEDIANNYKYDYLNQMSKHCQMLIYDWTQPGDTETVVEDIENVNFDNIDPKDTLLEQWRFSSYQWKEHAKNYTDNYHQLLLNNWICRTDVPELLVSGEDEEKHYTEMEKVPQLKYQSGYNPFNGDKNLLMKMKNPPRCKDYVTPLMKKYYERKAQEKSRRKST